MKRAFINALPKSGTNLLAKCLELLGYREVSGFASSMVLNPTIKSRIRRYLWMPMHHGYLIGIDSPVEIARWAVHKKINTCGPGMFVFGHVGYTSDLLVQLVRKRFALLVMLRDPRAVLNSFVHYVTANTNHGLHQAYRAMSVEERCLATLRGISTPSVNLQPLSIRCCAMDPWMKSSQVLKVRFEDLIGPQGGSTEALQKQTVEAIASHLDVTKTRVAAVMKSLFGPGRSTFRKGMIDSWRSEIPDDILPFINREIEDILIRWGYGEE